MEENIFQPLEEYYNRLKNQDNEVENAIKSFMEKHSITTYKIYIKGGKKYVDVIGNVDEFGRFIGKEMVFRSESWDECLEYANNH